MTNQILMSASTFNGDDVNNGQGESLGQKDYKNNHFLLIKGVWKKTSLMESKQ